MIVRREQAADVPAVRDVVAAAFAVAAHRTIGPDGLPIEVGLLDRLRVDEGWIPELSLVAVDPGGEVVGHVVCTRGWLGEVPVLGLGPVSVRPDRQRQGVGLAMMHAVLGAAEAREESLVALLGDPAYYRRYGFVPASQHGINPPDPQWGDYFQVRVLRPGESAIPTPGDFRYATPFQDL